MISRRKVLKLGMTLPVLMGASNSTDLRSPRRGTAKRMVLLYMSGGMSQIDTFDPKPGHPNSGATKALATSTPGVSFSDQLPRLARRANRLTVLRSLVGSETDHDRAEHLMHTGFVPQAGVNFPAFGSYVARAAPPSAAPGYISIGVGPKAGPGFLGPSYAPFSIDYPMRAASMLRRPRGTPDARWHRRYEMMRNADARFHGQNPSPLVETLRTNRQRAIDMLDSRLVEACDLSQESLATTERYGLNPFGKACLLARRFVDIDTPFVEVALPGWDTHVNIFRQLPNLCTKLDAGMSALLDDLTASGRLSTTLVVCVGEFGRTPRVNPTGGRHHYKKCSAALLAGGGIAAGGVVGATDPDGVEVVATPVKVPDLFASLAWALNLRTDEEFQVGRGRPIYPVDASGTVVPALFS